MRREANDTVALLTWLSVVRLTHFSIPYRSQLNPGGTVSWLRSMR